MAANLISPTALELLVQPLQEDEKRSEKKATNNVFLSAARAYISEL